MVPPLFRGCVPKQSAHYHDVRSVPKAVEAIFKEFTQGKDHMSAADLARFEEQYQGLPTSEEQAQSIIREIKSMPAHHFPHLFEHQGESQPQESGLDLAGFVKLLIDSKLNPPLKEQERVHDMTEPLSHYYVHTSHNSYLTGNQLWSKSSTKPLIAALKTGCRVIELDTWEKHGKLKVLHGGTLTKPVSFESCIKAILEHAFDASDYPVIITIENHLTPKYQVEAAKVLRRVLGDTLFVPTGENSRPSGFLSPEDLKRRIVISDKPFREPLQEQIKEDPEGAESILGTGSESPDLNANTRNRKLNPGGVKLNLQTIEKGARKMDEATPAPEEPRAHEFDELLYIYCQKPTEMAEKQEKGGPLVSGEQAIMANLSEPQLKTFIKSHPGSIIEYTKKNMGRVYPYGLRFDSSNADPMWAWSHGCQLAALNLQGNDRAAWLGEAFFYANGGCGYVRKPPTFLQASDVNYEEVLNAPPKLTLKVKILLGTHWHKLFDLFKKPDFYVRLIMKGIPSDSLKLKTKVAYSNKEPNWEDEEFEFPIRVPEIAVLRIEVWEDDQVHPDDFAGQRCLPVNELCSGIRAVSLRSKKGKERSSKLLCQFSFNHHEVQAGNGAS